MKIKEETRKRQALELASELVEQKRVDFSVQPEESHQLSLIKRTPQEIIEGWGFHEDRKMMAFNSRMKSKIMVAAMVNKVVDAHHH